MFWNQTFMYGSVIYCVFPHDERIRALSISSLRLCRRGYASSTPAPVYLWIWICYHSAAEGRVDAWAVCGIQWVVFTVQQPLSSWIKCTDSRPPRYVTIQSPRHLLTPLQYLAASCWGTSALSVSGLLEMRPALNAKLTPLFCALLPLQESETLVWSSFVVSTPIATSSSLRDAALVWDLHLRCLLFINFPGHDVTLVKMRYYTHLIVLLHLEPP